MGNIKKCVLLVSVFFGSAVLTAAAGNSGTQVVPGGGGGCPAPGFYANHECQANGICDPYPIIKCLQAWEDLNMNGVCDAGDKLDCLDDA